VIRRLNIVLLWLASACYAVMFIQFGLRQTLGQDSHAYWAAVQGGPLYEGRPTELDAYLYSPLFAQLITPLGWLPWHAFQGVWLLLGISATAWLVKPLPRHFAVPAFLFCVPDLVIGNIYIFLALMVALGSRHPSAWLFGVLTKVTPGVGLVRVLTQRDWRALARAAAVLVALVATSAALAPDDWLEWSRLLLDSRGSPDPTFIPRCVLAVALAAGTARRSPAWLAVAVGLATPVPNLIAYLIPLMAIPRLRQEERRQSSAPLPSGVPRAQPSGQR
jgi:hypothetical protein